MLFGGVAGAGPPLLRRLFQRTIGNRGRQGKTYLK
jgi:hypothetical protein